MSEESVMVRCLPSAKKLFRFQGFLSRTGFVLWGAIFIVLKFAVDSAIAASFFRQEWRPYDYLGMVQVRRILAATGGDFEFLAVMLVVAVPFIWIGVALTVRRLRDADLPLWMALLFFAPTINILFFVCLALAPSRRTWQEQSCKAGSVTAAAGSVPSPGPLGWVIPRGSASSAWMAMLVSGAIDTLLTTFSTIGLRVYGAGLFVGLPFSLGLIAALFHGYHHVRGAIQCVGVALGAVTVTASALLLIPFEGIGCLIMAAPLWLACAAIGGMVGFTVQAQARDQREAAIIITGLASAIPILMGAEFMMAPEPAVFACTSEVEVSAPPEHVWKHVIEFPELGPPDHWVFQTGVAYPIRAEILGHGVGAERRCEFSTGTFIEPIDRWEEPHVLGFSVTHNPPPMKEWNPLGAVDPPHLHGFLVSQAGEFRLTPVAGSRTRLQGTTWYSHHMWPAEYWRWWSDFIIHRIHLRVLNHVRDLSEQAQNERAS